MQFTYHVDSSLPSIIIEGEIYNHLFRSRRQKKESYIYTRNLKDNFLYKYEIVEILKKSATLKLIDKKKLIIQPQKQLEIIWCIIDPKEIERTLPQLNEIGVEKITFVYCENSQKNYKINIDKFNQIVINSSQQCGRSTIMRLAFDKKTKLSDIIDDTTYMLDFGGDTSYYHDITKIIIGCEGGFDTNEQKIATKKVGLSTDTILKSATAIVSIASKIIL